MVGNYYVNRLLSKKHLESILSL